MGKTLQELHLEAIERMRNKLFGRYKSFELGIKEKSEQILPPITSNVIGESPTLGGLKYRLIATRELYVSIEHFGGKRFNVFIDEVQENGPGLIRFANETQFDNLDNYVRRAYLKVMNDDGETK